MNLNQFPDSPFKIKVSFHKVLETLENIAQSDEADYRSNYAKALLKEADKLPELREGITTYRQIEKQEKLIHNLLADLFPTALTNNEIKAVTIPFQNITFNYTERFKKILSEAGKDFDMTIRDFDQHQFYVMNCCLILNSFYGRDFDFSRPLFYDIPDKNGIIRHYRIMYNADFMEIIPTEKSVKLSEEDIDQLIDNFDNFELWKEKFPQESWILKGFGIVILFDATIENSVSNLKSNLLRPDKSNLNHDNSIETIFRSIYKIADLRIGFTPFNSEEQKFEQVPTKKLNSLILSDKLDYDCQNALCECSFETLISEKKYFTISNVSKFVAAAKDKTLGNHLRAQNIQSCILAPVVKDDRILGIIELASSMPGKLNSLNANKLELIMPYIIDTLDRYNSEWQNHIEAVIQKEYTAIHPSVYWKFKKEAENYLIDNSQQKEYIFKEIVFKNVYPLYGQIDIKGSSDARNKTVQEDLRNQLETILNIFEMMKSNINLMILEQRKFEMETLLQELAISLKADTEQQIQSYIQNEIHPILKNARANNTETRSIDSYFEKLDPKTGTFYEARKKFDLALSLTNKKMASILDAKQIEAQAIFPHYYERFKTDGVEHNLYIGASIAPQLNFDLMFLQNLRLWQLQALCEMEMEHDHLKLSLPFQLEVTSLILVFSSPISIRFRMDEKRFDIDGTYNARYEVVKKRIDKANIKGKTERITEQGKITIVYSHLYEETEYKKYIQFLQFKGILEETVESFDVESLQGVSGLKALRVKVNNKPYKGTPKTYSYQELLDELK